jgi:uncharacterized protein YabE (DUF348 family)/3D (Asp-Asp-Asp) domain-containing protein
MMAIRRRPATVRGRSGENATPRKGTNGKLHFSKRGPAADSGSRPSSHRKRKPLFGALTRFFTSGFSNPGTSGHKNYSSGHYAARHAHPSSSAFAAAKIPDVPLFKDKSVVLFSIICLAFVAVSLITAPIAFAKNGVSVNLMDSGRTFTAQTTAKTVGEFLEKNDIEIDSDDYLETAADRPIEDGMDIIIRRAMPLTVNAGVDKKDISMIAGTVAEALSIAGVTLDPDDEVYPSADSYVRPGMTIDYIDVEVHLNTTTQSIGYQEVTREDDSLLKGDSEIVQYGEEGEMETETKQTYKNGVLYSEDVVSETVTKDPVNEIRAVGTKVIVEEDDEEEKEPDEPDSSGSESSGSGGPGSDQVREVRTMVATAYAGDSTTATGNYPRVASGSNYGTVAADPGVLPYGTMLYIPGYGYGRVEDTGGFVNGAGGSNMIDLYMGSEAQCNAWGRQTVTVYILK